MTEVEIHTEYIQLDQMLKLAGAVPSGGVVKEFIDAGEVLRNGVPERARRRKLVPGDVVAVDGIGTFCVVRA